MHNVAERVVSPISDDELKRRWTTVRKAMERAGIDVLVMQANNDFMGGYPKYFTDFPAVNGYPATVIFPRDHGMTVIEMGPFDRDVQVNGSDLVRRGVERLMTVPTFVSASYTRHYDAELALKALEPYRGAIIGLLGTASMAYAFVRHLKLQLPKATFVEASDLVDEIKAIKSPEELAFIRATAAMQDKALRAAFDALSEGKQDLEVAAVAELVAHQFGSEQGIYLCASGPVTVPTPIGIRHLQNRSIQNGDQFALLVENAGAGGFYGEIGRTAVLGKATQRMKDEFAFVLEARAFTLKRLRDGASSRELAAEYNEFMLRNGRPAENRLYCHSQGYDLVERPLVRHGETMRLRESMVLACHPGYVTDETFSWICDNFLITDGEPERLHSFPEEIVELS